MYIYLMGCIVFLMLSASSYAGEIFYCDDGRMLVVDNSNRREMADDDCIRAWFARNKAASELYISAEARRWRFLHAPSLPYCAGCGCRCSSCCRTRVYVYRSWACLG